VQIEKPRVFYVSLPLRLYPSFFKTTPFSEK
jgi:hypothetical protein